MLFGGLAHMEAGYANLATTARRAEKLLPDEIQATLSSPWTKSPRWWTGTELFYTVVFLMTLFNFVISVTPLVLTG